MSAPIIILGANGGIGEALARRLADQGHALFLTARDKASISDLAEELGAATASLNVMDPVGRYDKSEDIASMAATLLGPDSGWITGQVIGVDGGRGALRTRNQ
jgi:NAD(P)-dependent dehydrogenase (short-subunit alcohol dehydrogenase family)